MRVLIMSFVFVSSLLSSQLGNLFTEIFTQIFNKDFIRVYTVPKYYKYFINKKFILTRSCRRADFVFGTILRCRNKPVFTLDYKFYKKNRDVFGVFYYRKGRPQLKFKRDVLIRFFHKVPDKLEKFTE